MKGQPRPLGLIYRHCVIQLNLFSIYTVFKISTFQTFPYLNALGSKLDVDVK